MLIIGKPLGMQTDPSWFASVLGAAMLAVLIFNPPPRSVPLFPVGAGWAASSVFWGCLAVAAVMLVVAASRDPYRR